MKTVEYEVVVYGPLVNGVPVSLCAFYGFKVFNWWLFSCSLIKRYDYHYPYSTYLWPTAQIPFVSAYEYAGLSDYHMPFTPPCLL